MVNATEEEITRLLKAARVIAVVGLSPSPDRPSHQVAAYMKDKGYRIIPVRPACAELLGETCYPSLGDVPEPVDIVDVFRQSEYVPDIAAAAVRMKARALWLQEGVVCDEAAVSAKAAGLVVVQDRCLLKEHWSRFR